MKHERWNAVFIGGTGRCGTNVLKDILTTHSDVCALPFETRFPVDPDGVVHTYLTLKHSWSPFIADRALKRFSELVRRTKRKSTLDHVYLNFKKVLQFFSVTVGDRAYAEWELGKYLTRYGSAAEELVSSLTLGKFDAVWAGGGGAWRGSERMFIPATVSEEALRSNFRGFFSDVFGQLLSERIATTYVDDNTYNTLFGDVLCELVPGSKIIHMVRDPRDVVVSLRNQRWAPKDLESAIAFYESVMSGWWRVKERIPGARVTEVRLEDLVDETEHTIQRIMDFASLDRQLLSTKKIDLSRANIGRWHLELSEADKELVSRRLEPFANAYGYEST